MAAEGEVDDLEDKGKLNPKDRPPFQLCFSSSLQEGKSLLSRPKLPYQARIVTPKFYSQVDTSQYISDPIVPELIEEIHRLKSQGPREKYQQPVLESHNYGWHPEPLVPLVKTDRRYNHHLMTSNMVKVQCILHNAIKAERDFQREMAQKTTQE